MRLIEELENAFSQTSRLLLGAELKGLGRYEKWLSRHVPVPIRSKSAISGKDVWIPPSLVYLRKKFNQENVISLDEMDMLEPTTNGPEALEGASLRDVAGELVKPVRYYCGNFRYWTHVNVEECSGGGDGRNLYRCEDVYKGVKNVAFAHFTLYSENAFGCHGIMNSGFLIHAYNSTKITRCLEVDSCSNSSDLLFCHNCENVHDSMFCFNSKNLRNAIGNVQVKLEEYKRIKSIVLREMAAWLQEKADFGIDIFNVGCGGK